MRTLNVLIIYMLYGGILFYSRSIFGLVIVLTILHAFWLVKGLKAKIKRSRTIKHGYVYGFYDFGNILPAVKIGRSNTKYARLRSHQTAAPLGILTFFNLQTRNAHHAEKVLHNTFSRLRVSKRNEWFFITPSLLIVLLILRFRKNI